MPACSWLGYACVLFLACVSSFYLRYVVFIYLLRDMVIISSAFVCYARQQLERVCIRPIISLFFIIFSCSIVFIFFLSLLREMEND